MHVFQTDGDPPSRGRIILAIIGWTQNSSRALTNSVRANSSGKGSTPAATGRQARADTGESARGDSKVGTSPMSADLAVHDLVRFSRSRIGRGPTARVQGRVGGFGGSGPPDAGVVRAASA